LVVPPVTHPLGDFSLLPRVKAGTARSMSLEA
jgi:hypothetical protein